MANIEIKEINEAEVTEVETQEPIPVETDEAEDTGMSTGVVVMLTMAITAGVIWLGGKIKKKIDKHNAQKAAAEAVDAEDFEVDPEPADENEEA